MKLQSLYNKVPHDYSSAVSEQLNDITQLHNSHAILSLLRLLSCLLIPLYKSVVIHLVIVHCGV